MYSIVWETIFIKNFYNNLHDDKECKDKGNDIVLMLKFMKTS